SPPAHVARSRGSGAFLSISTSCNAADRDGPRSVVERTLVSPVVFRQQWLMRFPVNVAIHPSQFPENLRRDLVVSLRVGQLNHKFLYDGIKQTQKWLALHEACSPARNDIDCVETYDKAFGAAADRVAARHAHVISLGCGGGQKDVSLLKRLRQSGRQVSYTPCDVS